MGYCHDEATSAHRAQFDFLFAHAYAWAIAQGIERDESEAYASYLANENYAGEPEDVSSHRTEYAHWTKAKGA